jgi:hypothetical protein
MPDKPLVGGSKWTQEGIEPAKLYWIEAHAYQEAILDRIFELPTSSKREELVKLVMKQGLALIGLRAALHELEVIGIEAKRDRLNGENSQSQT